MNGFFIHIVTAFLFFCCQEYIFAQSSNTFTDLGMPDNIPAQRLTGKTSMLTDHENNIWIGTLGPGIQYNYGVLLKRAPDGAWAVYHERNSDLPHSCIQDLFLFDSTLYVATGRGLAIYSNGEFTVINQNNGLPSNRVNAVHVDESGLIVGTDLGLSYRSNNNEWIHFNTSNSPLPNEKVQTLLRGKENMLWIGTSNGLALLDHDVWTLYQPGSLNIKTLLLDDSNNLWIGTEGNGGLHKLVDDRITPVDDILGYRFDKQINIMSIAKGTDGSIYTSVKFEHRPHYRPIRIKDNYSWLYKYDVREPIFHYHEEQLFFAANPLGNLYLFDTDKALMFHNSSTIEVNNVNTRISGTGRLGTDWSTYPYLAFEIPSGSGKHALFTQSLWLAGHSETGNGPALHLAAEKTFPADVNDFWPGPLEADEASYLSSQHNWNKVWPMFRSEIDNHIDNWNQAHYTIPERILHWPAHHITESETRIIAPFADLNENGLFEPELGEYPISRGDASLFYVFNDYRHAHTASGGIPLGIEIRGLVYGYNKPEKPSLHNTLFMNFVVLNSSEITYSDMYMSIFTNFSIGYIFDDYIGCDTSLQAYFAYNGRPKDGNNEAESYGNQPPALGVTFLNNTLDAFIEIRNSASAQTGEPISPPEYLNYMQAKWRDGTPLTQGGTGYATATPLPERVMHLYSGDLNENDSWTEFTANGGNPNDPFDRRGLGTTFIERLSPGESVCFDLAIVFAQAEENSWPNGSVNLLKQHIAEVRDFYIENIPSDCRDIILTLIPEKMNTKHPTLYCYPNPATSLLTVSFKSKAPNNNFQIFDMFGRVVMDGVFTNLPATIDLKGLPKGIYIIAVSDNDLVLTQKIVKI